MRISFIVCAAGRGERAGFDKNKLLAPFMGANALYYTLSGIAKLAPILKKSGDELFETVVTACPHDMAEITAICAPFRAFTAEGGNTRTMSVYNALKRVTGDIVIIQDGARPYTHYSQYVACINSVKDCGSGIVAMPATDTVAIADDSGCIAHIPARKQTFVIQTPQGFYTKDIKTAYDNAVKDGSEYTDDSSVYSRYIKPAHLCMCGNAANKKLTFKEDFDSAEKACFSAVSRICCENSQKHLCDSNTATPLRCCGFGVDVHAFGRKQDFVTLCGVKIPCDEGLVAHSDGDVALHAVMDAILSAAGLRDIGKYFPDSDPAYRNADSAELLKKVIQTVRDTGYAVDCISVAVQAEKPRLSPYIDRMICRIEELTGTPCERVAISAGTCEGLGFVGEKRGICVYAVAVLKQI